VNPVLARKITAENAEGAELFLSVSAVSASSAVKFPVYETLSENRILYFISLSNSIPSRGGNNRDRYTHLRRKSID